MIDYGNKAFLPNPVDEFGTVSWYVKEKKEDEKTYLYACFRMTDCSRPIWLDFNIEKTEQLQQRLEKVDTIIKEATSFKERLVKAHAEVFYGKD